MIEFELEDEDFGIHISAYHEELKQLKDKDEIIIPAGKINIKFTYPLSNSKTISIVSLKDISKTDLINIVGQTYYDIYREEEETMKETKEELDENRENFGLINRGKSSGNYGIWGHDLEDLILEGIELEEISSGEYNVILFIGS